MIDVNSGLFKKGIKKRLPLNGRTEEVDTYLIPVEKLFFNDLNSRIATYSESYRKEYGESLSSLLERDKERYNDVVSGYIKESAADGGASFRATKEDIREKGQREPGVILTDGRIVDGNRRFTCIRELFKETGKAGFGYFEAAVLDASTVDAKTIKRLELALTFIDPPKEYNKVEQCAGFYLDVMKNHIISEAEYQYAANRTDSEMKNLKNLVETMLEYLTWLNQPEAFYIIKQNRLDGPFEELYKFRSSVGSNAWNEKKFAFFSYLQFHSKGDTTREMRELIKSAKEGGTLFNQVEKTAKEKRADIISAISGIGEKDETRKRETQRISDAIVADIKKSFDAGSMTEKQEKTALEPLQAIENSRKSLHKINTAAASNLDEQTKEKARKELLELEKVLQKVKDAFASGTDA